MSTNIIRPGLVLLVAAFLVLPLRAQEITFLASPGSFEPVGVTATEVNASVLPSEMLRSMSASWWKALRKEHRRALNADDFQTREQTLQNVIYFATHYQEESRLDRLSHKIYQIYRLDDNTQFRIMAVAALHAIGEETTMRQLAMDVRLEEDPRVRHVARAAVADYFKAREE